jgi:hypothetical protein
MWWRPGKPNCRAGRQRPPACAHRAHRHRAGARRRRAGRDAADVPLSAAGRWARPAVDELDPPARHRWPVVARAGPWRHRCARRRGAASRRRIASSPPSLCRALGVTQNLAAPTPVIQALFGQRAAIVLGSTRVVPRPRWPRAYVFRFASLQAALDDLLAPLRGRHVATRMATVDAARTRDRLALFRRCAQPGSHHAGLLGLQRTGPVDARRSAPAR